MAQKKPKEVWIDHLPMEDDIMSVSTWNYQEKFLYGKSIEAIDYNTGVKNKPVTTSTKKYCFSTKSSNQSISNTTGTTITLDTHETNDNSMSDGTNRIIITQGGQYLVSAVAQFAINSIGSREVFLRVNGGTIFSDIFTLPNPSDLTSVCINTIQTFSANDYIEMRVYQNSWGNLNVNSWIANTFLKVHQL